MQIKNIILNRENTKFYDVISAKINNKTEPTADTVINNLGKVLIDMYNAEKSEKTEVIDNE